MGGHEAPQPTPEVHGGEAFGEPAVDRSEQIAGFIALALIAPEARHAHRCTKEHRGQL